MGEDAGTTTYVHRAWLWGRLGLLFAQLPIYLSQLFDEPWRAVLAMLGGVGLLSSLAAVVYGNRTTKRLNQRFEHRLCLECGYDLRTKPARCPECGADNPYLSEEPPATDIPSPDRK